MLKNLFSKKTSIKLSKVLELKKLIEDELKKNHKCLKLENSVLQGQKRNYDLKKLVKESTKLCDQLIQLKVVIQKANLVIPEGETLSISHHVYVLSEKKTQILNLMSMVKTAFEGVGKDDEGNTVTYGKPIFTRDELDKWVNDLRTECRAIEKKLTQLNDAIIVELPFKTNLV
jgi:hydroxylamine reductase (hybrid-cluster protein)